MDMAHRVAEMSHAVRRKVGSVMVKDGNIISFGWNGMPAGWDNKCEDKEFMSGDAGGWLDFEEIEERWPFEEEEHGPYYESTRRYRLKTKPEVLHAESNAIAKLAKSSESGRDAIIFITHAPCIDCAKLIYQSGISSVYYRNSYRDMAGVEFLTKSGIEVTKTE
jgi:dCMP deaminase